MATNRDNKNNPSVITDTKLRKKLKEARDVLIDYYNIDLSNISENNFHSKYPKGYRKKYNTKSLMTIPDDGNPMPDTPGCTNPSAINFNEAATEDDGSCYWVEDNIALQPYLKNDISFSINVTKWSDFWNQINANLIKITRVDNCNLPGEILPSGNFGSDADLEDYCETILPGDSIPSSWNYSGAAFQVFVTGTFGEEQIINVKGDRYKTLNEYPFNLEPLSVSFIPYHLVENFSIETWGNDILSELGLSDSTINQSDFLASTSTGGFYNPATGINTIGDVTKNQFITFSNGTQNTISGYNFYEGDFNSYPLEIIGCMDSTNPAYNPSATINNDGYCIQTEDEETLPDTCQDPSALNYGEPASDLAGCYDFVNETYGITYSGDFYLESNQTPGGCCYNLLEFEFGYQPGDNNNDGQINILDVVIQVNWIIGGEESYPDVVNYSVPAYNPGGGAPAIVYGCMDPNACGNLSNCIGGNCGDLTGGGWSSDGNGVNPEATVHDPADCLYYDCRAGSAIPKWNSCGGWDGSNYKPYIVDCAGNCNSSDNTENAFLNGVCNDSGQYQLNCDSSLPQTFPDVWENEEFEDNQYSRGTQYCLDMQSFHTLCAI